MKKLRLTATIDADRGTVWERMLALETYRIWTAAGGTSRPGSRRPVGSGAGPVSHRGTSFGGHGGRPGRDLLLNALVENKDHPGRYLPLERTGFRSLQSSKRL